jgi:hypothetical protein
MHDSGPKLLIVAKKEVMGNDRVDFDGPGYVQAKKMVLGEQSAEAVDRTPCEAAEPVEYRDVVGRLKKLVMQQAEQSNEIRQLVEEIDGQRSTGQLHVDGQKIYSEGKNLT